MELGDLTQRALEIQRLYHASNAQGGNRPWTAAEYMQGFVGDVGDLAKLVMARNDFRHVDDVDEKLGHELADCLWSILVLASELHIDLEATFLETMDELNQRLTPET